MNGMNDKHIRRQTNEKRKTSDKRIFRGLSEAL